jgi:hypothetical protein
MSTVFRFLGPGGNRNEDNWRRFRFRRQTDTTQIIPGRQLSADERR